jgi:hypothetical protein
MDCSQRETHVTIINRNLTEISTRNIKIIMFLESKVRRVLKADDFTAIYEPIV